MEPNELNINLPPDMQKDVVIRTGEALPLKEQRQLSLSGIITTVGDFVVKRVTEIPLLKANVVANYTNRTIVLIIGEDDPYFGTVTGKLDVFPELKELKINQKFYYDEKELYKTLNFFGRWFKDAAVHSELMKKLQDFKAKVTQKFVNADDFKGKAAFERLTDIEHDIQLTFDLLIPVFSGFDPYSFKVDIQVTIRDGGISFWLESKELHELISVETEKIFATEIARLEAYVIVKQW